MDVTRVEREYGHRALESSGADSGTQLVLSELGDLKLFHEKGAP